jgi:hypothetical protein
MNARLMSILVLACCWPSAVISQNLPYGPDTCKQGYVWRDAYPGDHACVPPLSREEAAADNRMAAQRRQPGGGPYGPDTCRQGWVWREARPGDVVCVSPDVRARTAQENRLAPERRAAAAAGPPVVVKVDEQCHFYASRAVQQFKLAQGRRACAVRPDGRWQANYDAHYNWCLTAAQNARAGEQHARDDWLFRCGAQVRLD